MNIVVTGAGGFIGSCLIEYLSSYRNLNIIAIDKDFSKKHQFKDKVEKIEANIKDIKYFQHQLPDEIDILYHFAGEIFVGESVCNPEKYYKNNLSDSMIFLDQVLKKTKQICFSSTAGLYKSQPISILESGMLELNNPYANSKFLLEEYIKQKSNDLKIKFCIMRFFNVVGSMIFNGPNHQLSMHLLSVMADKGRDPILDVNGTDYDTPDGSCIRDYIHIKDLISAMVKANVWVDKNQSDIFNAGYSKGFSVLQMVQAYNRFAGPMDITIRERRKGDPAILIANNLKLRSIGWKPEFDSLEKIIRDHSRFRKLIKNHRF